MAAFEVKPFRLFSSSSDETQQPQNPLPPPPPCLEVLPSAVPLFVQHAAEPVNLGGVSLLKGRVSTEDVFQLSNSDLVPGRYEGGLKLWEGSLDLVKSLQSEIKNGQLVINQKQVLELGCGHGLPGIFTGIEGAAAVHFQDFNAEVLQCLTIPNLNANILKKSQSSETDLEKSNPSAEFRFFAGDWRDVHQILPCAHHNDDEKSVGYDIILMAETVYSLSVLPHLFELIKKCLDYPNGVVYMAAKKYYFGVGGGSRQFLSLVEQDGAMKASMVAEVADGSSNLREVWKLQFK